MQETGYETFSFYYDALTENVDYPARAAYLDGLVQKYLRSAKGHAGSGVRYGNTYRGNGETWI
ncbi:MAG: hypothetical protein ACLUOF_05370 [Ruminococcus sp.]